MLWCDSQEGGSSNVDTTNGMSHERGLGKRHDSCKRGVIEMDSPGYQIGVVCSLRQKAPSQDCPFRLVERRGCFFSKEITRSKRKCVLEAAKLCSNPGPVTVTQSPRDLLNWQP